VNDLELGAVVRRVRRHRGLRQVDVARLSGADQAEVSRVERGRLEEVGLRTIRRICQVLEISLRFSAHWRGGLLPRLLDRDHAALVALIVRDLSAAGWETLVEYTFNVYGERGSVDVVGWHAPTRTLLIVEVKGRIVDQQDLFASTDRKLRLVPPLLARDRGWQAAAVGVLLAVGESTFNRTVVRRHRAVFDTRFPSGTRDVRRWIMSPSGPVGGILFLRDMSSAHARHDTGGPDRVRVPRQRARQRQQ
jgi:transcriptional regulator with XRE-family HTH domain